MVALSWLKQAFLTLVNALLTLFIGFLIGKIAGRLTKRALVEAEINRILREAGVRAAFDSLAGAVVEYLIYVISVMIALQQLGLARIVIITVTSLAIVVVGISLVLWLRDFVPNALVGLLWRKTLNRFRGKEVRIGSVSGKLREINILESIVKRKNDELHIPHVYTVMRGIKERQPQAD